MLASMAMLAAVGASGAFAATPLPAPRGSALCEGCHGASGEGMAAAAIPRLAAQAPDYLKKQLDDYASGTRENPIMANWAKQLDETQRAALADYYSSLTAPYTPERGELASAAWERGRQLARQGDEVERVQACDNCHGPEGRGVPHAAPYLACQSAEYIVAALKSWQRHTRRNDNGKLMTSVVSRLQDADIAAVAAYYASLGDSAKP